MNITIIAVPSGYQAVAFNQTGTIDFWTDIRSWQRAAVSSYPYHTGTTPAAVSVQATVLGSTANAVFILKNPAFLAAGGYTIYSTGPNGWGVVTAQSPTRLASCGCGTRQVGTNSPGFPRDRSITFSGDDVIITSSWVTTENGVRNTATYPLITQWKWTGNDFTADGSDIFEAEAATAPNIGAPPLPLTGHANGTWTAVITKITGTNSPSSTPLKFTLIPGDPKNPTGPSVTVSVPKDTPMTTPAITVPSPRFVKDVTAPAWMTAFINPTRSGQAAFTRLSTEGATPYYVPRSLHLTSPGGLVRLIRTKHEVASITFTNGAVTSFGVFFN